MSRLFAMLGLCAAASLTMAQAPAPSDSVTVTTQKQREAVEEFIKAAGGQTRITGKIARWETPICLDVNGLTPKSANFIASRVKEVATEVGARLRPEASCRPNLRIIFTPEAQLLVDGIKRRKGWLLGYFDSVEERDGMARIQHPVQAFSATATFDVRGMMTVDEAKNSRKDIHASKLNDGLRSGLFHVMIFADPAQLKGFAPETVADYVAMLALQPLRPPGACQKISSIANLLAKDCTQAPEAMTANDMSYLRAIYAANPGLVAHLQTNEIANEMEKALGGR